MRFSIYSSIILILFFVISCGDDQSKVKSTTQKASPETAKNNVPKGVKPELKVSESSWPMFMHDISYLGKSPDRTLKPPLGLLWKFKTGGPVISSPIVVNETVYIGSEDHRLYALNAKEWGLRWEFDAGDKIISAPTFSDGYIYFSSRNNKVYALDALTGEKRWEFQADGWINSPVVAFRRKIYLGCYDKKIYVLNAFSGKLESQTLASIKIGDQTYVCSQGDFYPLDFQYQAQQWRSLIPNSESWPVRANNVVYMGARDSKIYGIDYGTRKIIWQYETGGWVDSSPAIADGVLYIGSNDGYVYAFTNASSAPPQVAQTSGREGVVASNGARIYSRLDNRSEVIARAYEGEYLKIINQSGSEWYQVMLPNQKPGWISWLDFIPIRQSEDLQINDALIKEVKPLNLPQTADRPSWSPDGSAILFFDNVSISGVYWKGGSIWLASGDGNAPKLVASGAFFNSRVSWSGDGRLFAVENLYGKRREIWMAKSNGAGLRQITEGEAPSISPKGDSIAFIRRNKTATSLWLLKLDNSTLKKLVEIPINGEQRYVAYGYIADMETPAWSPDGSGLAVGFDGYHYVDNNSRIGIINASGGLIREIGIRAERVGEIAWSPNGKYIGFVTQEHPDRRITNLADKRVHITSVDRTGREEIFQHSDGISWSPKGRYMAFIEENSSMGIKKKIWLFDIKNWLRIQLLASRDNIQGVTWLADGKIAITAPAKVADTKSRIRGWLLSIQSLPE